jgi:hypothetical protein
LRLLIRTIFFFTIAAGRTPPARYAGDAAGSGGAFGGPRARGSFAQGRPSLSAGLDSGGADEAQLPLSARAALAAAAGGGSWRGSGRGGGGGGGRQSWQDRSAVDTLDDTDVGPYGSYNGAGGAPTDLYFNRSYERTEPATSGAPGPPKRQRLADGAPVNGRGGSAGGRGRGRNSGPSAAAAPSGPGSVVLPGRGAGSSVAAALAQRQQLQINYDPLIEVKDVQEEEDGRRLSLTFLHSTLGTFAGSLALLAAAE